MLLRGLRWSCLLCELLDHLIYRYRTSGLGSPQFAFEGGLGKALHSSWMLKKLILDYIKTLTKKYMCLMLQRKIISLVYELGGWTEDPRGFFPPEILCFCGNGGKTGKLGSKSLFVEQDGRRPSFCECSAWLNVIKMRRFRGGGRCCSLQSKTLKQWEVHLDMFSLPWVISIKTH